MDVVRRGLFLSFFLLTVSACSENKTTETIFNSEKTGCGASAVRNHFIIKWVDGKISRIKSADKEAFLKEHVEPNLEKIEFAEYDYRVQIQDELHATELQPTAAFADNWGASNVNVAGAWQRNIRGNGVTVAVVDSGVSIDHNQLVGQIAYNKGETGTDSMGRDKRFNGVDDDGNGFADDFAGYDFSQNTPNIQDNSEHGTHVSGVIAAEHHDSQVKTGYVQGIAPEAKILPATFIGPDGSGYISDAIRALNYAAQRGAKVINASWGGAPCSQALKQTIAGLQNSGVIFVVASGNEGKDIDRYATYPAAFGLPNQITVGAIGFRNGMANFSNYGNLGVHVFAPGVEVVSTIPGNSTAAMDGTSMATPFVAGAVALMLGHRPTASADQIRAALYNSVYYDRLYRNASHGRINISAALDALEDLAP